MAHISFCVTFQKLALIYSWRGNTRRNKWSLSFSACRCFTALLFPGSHTFSLIIYSLVFLSPLVCLLLNWSPVFIPLSDNFFGPVSCMSVMPFLSASVESLMGSKGGRLAFCCRLISKLERQGHCQRLCWWSKGTGNYSRSRAATSLAGERECVCVLDCVWIGAVFCAFVCSVCVCVCACVCVSVCIQHARHSAMLNPTMKALQKQGKTPTLSLRIVWSFNNVPCIQCTFVPRCRGGKKNLSVLYLDPLWRT